MKKAILIFLTVISALGLTRGASLTEGPFLTWVTNQFAYVNFVTDAACVASVDYGLSPALDRSVSDGAATTIHNIQLTGLEPNNNYRYRIVVDGATGPVYTFVSAPAPLTRRDFKFVAYGDTRTGHYFHGAICNHIMAKNPEFIMHSGDVVEDGEDNGDWRDFFEIVAEDRAMACKYPMFYALGNHDDESEYFYNIMALPDNNPAGTEAYNSWDWGPIHFVAINTEIPYGTTSPQYAWLEADLAAAAGNYDFIVVFFHRPPYASGGHGSEIEVREIISPLLEIYGVDIAFCGHNHLYERTVPIAGVTYITSGGGGAPLVPLALWQDFTAHGECIYNYCICTYTAASRQLKIVMRNLLDEPRDSVILSAPVEVEGEDIIIPQEFRLFNPYPNPFNRSITIPFHTTRDLGLVEFKIYNLQGETVEKFLVSVNAANTGRVIWDPHLNDSQGPKSGIYLVKAGDQTKKLVFLK
ncbi:metallophosphoesterase [bacterium]|nr:metallophosphoesterase [bacterium]